MNNHNPIKKRIEELRKENKTYIIFNERYLLEGEQVGLGRVGESMRYIGDRFTDYGVEPPKVIEIKDCTTTSDLEKLFGVEDEWGKSMKAIGCGKILGTKVLQGKETKIGCGDTYYIKEGDFGKIDYCERCKGYKEGYEDALHDNNKVEDEWGIKVEK